MERFIVVSVLAGTVLACGPRPTVSNDANPNDATADGPITSIPGDRYCEGIPRPVCPTGTQATCGVCVRPPEDRAQDRLRRTSCAELRQPEYCDPAQPSMPANLSCYTGFDPANPPQLEPSQMVTVWGVVDVFGTGGDADNIQVQIFAQNSDGSLGPMLGEAIARVSFYSEEDVELSSGGEVRQRRRLGGFKIDNIPTERPVVVRTQGDPNFFGHPVYDYTVAIRNREINHPMPPPEMNITGPAVRIRPRTLANADWTTIPSTAALPTGIPAGHGVLAGEVHDCDDVRLSNAMVYSNPPPHFENTVYFSNNDTRPLPDTSRNNHGTQLLGLYALLDLDPGPVQIAALGYNSDGELVHVGSYRARIFPDAVTVVTLRGLRPWQVTRP